MAPPKKKNTKKAKQRTGRPPRKREQFGEWWLPAQEIKVGDVLVQSGTRVRLTRVDMGSSVRFDAHTLKKVGRCEIAGELQLLKSYLVIRDDEPPAHYERPQPA